MSGNHFVFFVFSLVFFCFLPDFFTFRFFNSFFFFSFFGFSFFVFYFFVWLFLCQWVFLVFPSLFSLTFRLLFFFLSTSGYILFFVLQFHLQMITLTSVYNIWFRRCSRIISPIFSLQELSSISHCVLFHQLFFFFTAIISCVSFKLNYC
jgi:hypothetical protein